MQKSTRAEDAVRKKGGASPTIGPNITAHIYRFNGAFAGIRNGDVFQIGGGHRGEASVHA